MKLESPLFKAAEETPSKKFIISETAEHTFGEIASEVCQVSSHLKEYRITPGDRVALLSSNSVEYIIALLALWKLGASAVLLNVRAHPREWWNLLEAAQCEILLAQNSQVLNEAFDYQVIQMTNLMATDSAISAKREGSEYTWDLTREAAVVMTSGSTGVPKGVCLSLGNLYYNALGVNERLEITQHDCWLLSLPLFHVGGLGVVMRMLLAGGKIATSAGNSPKVALEIIEKKQVTHISIVPTMLTDLVENDDSGILRRLKAIVLGGAAPGATLLRRCRELQLPVLRTYGFSEAASQVTLGAPHLFNLRPDSSGEVLPYREIRINPEDEIEVRGEVVFSGYVDETEKRTSEDWFHTRDIGKIDSDGNLCVLGRKDDLIISGGENIYPAEIEQAISEISKSLEAKVIGVDNQKWGQRPVAFILPKDDSEVDTDELRKKLAESIAKFRLPDKIIVVDKWPLNSLGKIDLAKLREVYLPQGI